MPALSFISLWLSWQISLS